MLRIGCHLSCAKGYAPMAKQAASIGANPCQFFSRNPRGGNARAEDPEDMAAFLADCAANDFGPLVAHAPYTLNACSPKAEVRDFARRAMAEDLRRLAPIPGILYNFHPGSRVDQPVDTAAAQIAEMLDAIVTADTPVTVLLETMSGKGSEMGGSFEELRLVMDRAECGSRLGVCLDTCHVHDAGYDLVHDPDGVLTAFDRIIGLDRLKAVHVNDSRNPCGSKKDRHEKLGQGTIGLEALLRLMKHPALRDLPFILETPNELPGYQAEIAKLKEMWT